MQGRREEGSAVVMFVLFLVVLCAVAAYALDLGAFRAHRRQLQSAADAGAIAAAMQLPPFADGSQSCTRGAYYERQNSDLTDPHNMIKNANLDTSDCVISTDGPSWAQVRPVEASVPWVFARVLNLVGGSFAQTTIDARARAQVVYLTRSKGLLPFGVEDLRPKTVSILLKDGSGNVVQTIPLAQGGCSPTTTTDGFPYWCNDGGSYVNSVPSTGASASVQVVDATGQTITWDHVGYIATDQPLPGCSSSVGACVVKNAVLTPLTDDSLYYYSSSTPAQPQVTLRFAIANMAAGDTTPIQVRYDNGQWTNATSLGGGQYQVSFSDATTEEPLGQDFQVRYGKQGSPTPTAPVQHTYARDDGDILQSLLVNRHYIDPSLPANDAQRSVTFDVAFQVLVKGREMTLKLGGGGAQGNSGNYQGLDLDTNTSWPVYHCYAKGGTPNAADEVQHGACTPYAIGDTVQTQTGNFAGQVQNGLDARIGSSPDNWTGPSNPPSPGDPRWMALILVPPLTFSNCSGTCTTSVIGFGNFYITQYGPPLKPGEVRGVFWDHPNILNDYTTTCNDPANICLASVALVPTS